MTTFHGVYHIRELTAEEMQQVSGEFNRVVWGYTIGFAIGAASASPLGPAGMLAGGIVGGFGGAVYAGGTELVVHGTGALVTGKDPGVTETYY